MSARILLVGLGSLGGLLLEFLARQPACGPILAAGRDIERGQARCNLARVGALAYGVSPDISFHFLDLDDPEAAGATIKKLSPDLIISTATRMSWWLPRTFQSQKAERLQAAGFGVWLPVHLSLSLNLMQALKSIQYRGLSLLAPFPDVTCPVLSAMDLAPTCGIGNLDEIVPKVRLLAAEKLGASPQSVRVYLVAHHALEDFVFRTEPLSSTEQTPPYFLRVEYQGEDVTEQVAGPDILFSPFPLPPGQNTHFLTASSAVRLVRALISPWGETGTCAWPQRPARWLSCRRWTSRG